MEPSRIRNFCILAHIDHGKSTLADRFLEITHSVEKRKMRSQFLDINPIERERGITIKMQPVRMRYILPKDSREYQLNLIDTPGHVDFAYEVSRALAAVEGAILLVDATQGVQAQTLANLHAALEENLVIIPAINKIDLPSAEIEKTEEEIMQILNVQKEDILKISAKDGMGVKELLEKVIEKVPPPFGAGEGAKLKALIFDSMYDSYLGAVAYVRIFTGSLMPNSKIYFAAAKKNCEALELGMLTPDRVKTSLLSVGEIGFVSTGIKETDEVRVGDTILSEGDTETDPLPGYREPEPMVFASIYPENQDDFEVLRESLKKLRLNDAAFTFSPESGSILGRGFRAGFLGMLHIEIVAERLEREYGLNPIFSNPSVAFRIQNKKDDKNFETIYSAAALPETHEIFSIEEPWVEIEIITPPNYLGSVTTLINTREGILLQTSNVSEDRLLIKAESPLRQIIIDFYDILKSITQGFASMAYKPVGYRKADLTRLDILVAGEKVPAFSEIVPKKDSYRIGRQKIEKLKQILPHELFAVSLQAESEGRIIARETITALKKDVTGYLYGGDRSRKMKLWKKQQRGKKRLKAGGSVEISPEVFLQMLKPGSGNQ